MPLIVPPVSISGTLQYYWIDPLGNERDLNKETSPNLYVIRGSVGLGFPEFELEDVKLPINAGSLVLHVNTQARRIELPILIHEETFEDLLVSAEAMFGWFQTGNEQQKTPGKLKIVRPDDTIRVLNCYFIRGLEGNTEEGAPNWVQYNVELYAPDPWPTDEEDIVEEYTVAEAASFSVINPGKEPSYPIWTISGPIVNLTITKNSTNETISLLLTLTAGEFVVIDTRPSEVRPGFTVYDHDGTNLGYTVDPASSMFSLDSGVNVLSVAFTSGTTVDTAIELAYLPKHRSMLR